MSLAYGSSFTASLTKSNLLSSSYKAISETDAEVFLASAIRETVRLSPTMISNLTNLSMSSERSSRFSIIAVYVCPPSRIP